MNIITQFKIIYLKLYSNYTTYAVYFNEGHITKVYGSLDLKCLFSRKRGHFGSRGISSSSLVDSSVGFPINSQGRASHQLESDHFQVIESNFTLLKPFSNYLLSNYFRTMFDS